jgi:2-polyprenyl-3-methyl-5-hydroxy-6-metoxy-1,4-benzoquinol methylase
MDTEYNKHKKCLISDETRLIPLKGYEKHYLVKSHKTGFVFCERIPTELELQINYSNYSRNDDISPVTISRYEELLLSFEKYRKNNTILDVGCGNGHFLKVAKEKGWKVYGTEYTEDAIEICTKKGLIMHSGKLDVSNYEPDFFDVITSFEVIEHINNPQEDVQNIRTILRKGGLFYLTTPNFNALERYILRDQYNVICYPEHLSYYTPSTINYLLTRYNFEKVSVLTTGTSISRIKSSLFPKKIQTEQKQETRNSKQNIDESLRKMTEGNPLGEIFKKSMNLILNFFKIGNSLKASYIKK